MYLLVGQASVRPASKAGVETVLLNHMGRERPFLKKRKLVGAEQKKHHRSVQETTENV